jgi:molecular chaperone GrpE
MRCSGYYREEKVMTAAKRKDKKDLTKDIPKEEKIDIKSNKKDKSLIIIEELEKEKVELTDSYRRLAAEFDNFRKRTIREKDEMHKNSTANLIEAFLPVIDSMEMAKTNADENVDKAALKKGIELVYRQFREVLDKIDIDEIECQGEEFNPELHNAIMHISDDAFGENEIIEVLQKGYIYKDKVIRHSLVKVAN